MHPYAFGVFHYSHCDSIPAFMECVIPCQIKTVSNTHPSTTVKYFHSGIFFSFLFPAGFFPTHIYHCKILPLARNKFAQLNFQHFFFVFPVCHAIWLTEAPEVDPFPFRSRRPAHQVKDALQPTPDNLLAPLYCNQAQGSTDPQDGGMVKVWI